MFGEQEVFFVALCAEHAMEPEIQERARALTEKLREVIDASSDNE